MAWLYYNKFDFTKVEKKARTKATSSLKANLERASNISTKKLKSKARTQAGILISAYLKTRLNNNIY